MATGARKASIDVLGDMVDWGAHFCVFYETKEDLLNTLVSYYKAGLENGEYCLWIVAEPLTVEEATGALRGAMPNLDRHLEDSSLEFTSAREWFLQGGTFDGKRVTSGFYERLARASTRGYPGMRVAGDTTWLLKKDWRDWCDYEDGLNEVIGNQRLAGLCSYPLAACGAAEVLDVVRTHQFALARRHGSWDVVETAGLKRAKAEITRLNEELERRVVERTSELMKASEALREASRLTTMGELAGSIAHEVNQPLTAIMNNGSACLRLLANSNLDPEVLRRALEEIVADGTRANAVITRIRAFIKKTPGEKSELDMNQVIQEVLALASHDVQKNRAAVECELKKTLPLVRADRVQLQQVLLNLIMNGIEAMTAVTDRPRMLWVQSQVDDSGDVLVSVRDSGIGLGSEADRVFTPFFTTKANGMGMGLSISRSLIDDHGGRLWAAPNSPHGAVFSFTLPIAAGSTS